jgi:RNA polymerase sigma factor (sigma-70 family)
MQENSLRENEIILGLRNNDSKILRVIYKKSFPSILKYILTNSGSEEEARDVFQESMIVLYRNAQKENFELSSSVQTYLYAIAKRLWLKKLKGNSWLMRLDDKEQEDEDAGFSVSGELTEYQEKELQYEKIQKGMAKLGEPCHGIIKDFYVHHKNMVEISEKYGYTNADNAKNQKYKCLQRLKKIYFSNNEEGGDHE